MAESETERMFAYNSVKFDKRYKLHAYEYNGVDGVCELITADWATTEKCYDPEYDLVGEVWAFPIYSNKEKELMKPPPFRDRKLLLWGVKEAKKKR